jgi:hypothetical protein
MTIMSDDNVLAALDAFVGEFDPDNGQGIDDNDNLKSSKTSPPPLQISLRARGAWQKKREERGEEKTHKVSSTEWLTGLTGEAIDNIYISQAAWEMRWHLDHGERVPPTLCAGCRRPFAPGDEVLELADGNRVHLGRGASSGPLLRRDQPKEDGPPDGYACLIAWGERWRSAAHRALTKQREPC